MLIARNYSGLTLEHLFKETIMKKTVLISFLTIVGGITGAKAATFSVPTLGIVGQPIRDKSVTLNSVVEKIEKKRSEALIVEKNLKLQDKSLAENGKKMFKEDLVIGRMASEKRLRNIRMRFGITMRREGKFPSQSTTSLFKDPFYNMHNPH
jgi:hypothetical protein